MCVFYKLYNSISILSFILLIKSIIFESKNIVGLSPFAISITILICGVVLNFLFTFKMSANFCNRSFTSKEFPFPILISHLEVFLYKSDLTEWFLCVSKNLFFSG